jgi:hypothetical protein
MHLTKRSEPAFWFGLKESACKFGPHGMERIMERKAARPTDKANHHIVATHSRFIKLYLFSLNRIHIVHGLICIFLLCLIVCSLLV